MLIKLQTAIDASENHETPYADRSSPIEAVLLRGTVSFIE